MKICGSCGMPISSCRECGGLKCVPGCADRAEDGCVCGLEDAEKEDTDVEETDDEDLDDLEEDDANDDDEV